MAENSFKLKKNSSGKTVFARLESALKLDVMLENGLPIKYLPYVGFTTLMVILYIGSSHYAEKTIRQISKLEVEVEDMRADYTTLKADYMYERLQSEVAKRVKEIGLEESSEPPYKIVIAKK